MIRSLAILGEFSAGFGPHVSTNAAIAHSNKALGFDVAAEWVSTERIDASLFQKHAGIWVAPGSPYKDFTKRSGRFGMRENAVPCFGTCGGFQHLLIEYARHVLGFADAQHAEYDPNASELFISRLACSLADREMWLNFVPGSRVAVIYGSLTAIERYYCNFAVDCRRVETLKSGPLQIVGSDAEGEIRVVELPQHPFFIATLFVPQARSKPGAPHPLVNAFLKAVAGASG